MASVYIPRRLVFGQGTSSEVLGEVFVNASPLEHGAPLRPAQRRAALRASIRAARKTGLKHCLVLDSHLCVYIEADGHAHIHKSKPDSRLGSVLTAQHLDRNAAAHK